MSDRPVPAYVDTRKIFLQQGTITGSVALERMSRFRESLASDAGSVSVDLQFLTDDSGQQIISGHLLANVEVICQRCLEPTGIVLQDDIRLSLLKDESKVTTLDPNFDPWICVDNKLDLASLVEEQLLLCMPIVSYHDVSQCGNKLGIAKTESKSAKSEIDTLANPFSILKSLKENDETF